MNAYTLAELKPIIQALLKQFHDGNKEMMMNALLQKKGLDEMNQYAGRSVGAASMAEGIVDTLEKREEDNDGH